MKFSLSRWAVLWLGCMVGCTSSLRESVAQNAYDHAQQGLRQRNAEYTVDSTRAQAGYLGPTRTSRKTSANEGDAYFGVPPTGTPYSEEKECDTPEGTSVQSTKSSKGTKYSKKVNERSKDSKKSSKDSGKGRKSDTSNGVTSSTSVPGYHTTPTASPRHNPAPTASPRHHRNNTEKPTTAPSSHGEEEQPIPDVDENESLSDFPSQAPTCKECDDGEIFSASNALAVEQDRENTRRHVAKVVVAVVLAIIVLLSAVHFLTRSWRRGVVHSSVEATHDDKPAPDSRFSDSDVTVVLFEDDNEDDDAQDA